MRLGAFLVGLDDDFLRFLQQYGVTDVVGGFPSVPNYTKKFPLDAGDQLGCHWEYEELVQLRERIEAFGMTLSSMENPHPAWCFDQVQLGLPGRDQQLENLSITIRNMGRAGIPYMGYNWMVNPAGLWRFSTRTSTTYPARGGAQTDHLNMDELDNAPLFRDREYGAEEMWENYEYFVRTIVPVLEEAGVRMGVHPDDPPVPSLGGIARIFNSPENYQRAMDLTDSPTSGINLCLGNWTAMGTDILASVRQFGEQGRILYGHAQGVQGTVPNFKECFLDEADCDYFEIVRAFNELDLDTFLLVSHLPRTVNDGPPQFQGHAFAMGFMAGIIKAANSAGADKDI
jgi:mannonate dehydratase